MTAKASGGMLNPAVSAGVLVAGEMPPARCAIYMVAQLAGAAFAALLASLIHVHCTLDGTVCQAAPGLSGWSLSNVGPGCRAPLPDEARGAVFVYELLGTFVLVLTVLATAVAKPGMGDLAPFAIGLSIFVVVGACGSITGGFFNPARFFGPAIIFGCNLQYIWLYWIAQILGGLLAGMVHRLVLERPEVNALIAKGAHREPSEAERA
jgi:glycerol uptake facilitator-like aquaporin